MKKKSRQRIPLLLVFICVILFTILFGGILQAENIIVPGDENRICYYSNFFFNQPTEDFLYYFNDFLLFSEKPDELIMTLGIRNRLMWILSQHNAIKEYIHTLSDRKDKTSVTFNLGNPDGFSKAAKLMELLGRQLKMDEKENFQLSSLSPVGYPDYFQFALLQQESLLTQINQTKFFTFKLKESETPLLPGLNIKFFREATRLPMNESNFYEYLVKDERFSLFFGVVSRMSNAEVRYISGLRRQSSTGAINPWQEIFKNKRLLMGLFVLSNSLRVDEQTGKLFFPGGASAESFWKSMTDNCDNGSFDFIERLATQDDGKLNYLFTFTSFLKEDVRKALLCNYDPILMKNVYPYIALDEKEKLSDTAFPLLGYWNYFTLGYVLKTENGKLYFPGGIESWIKAISGDTGFFVGGISSDPVISNTQFLKSLGLTPETSEFDRVKRIRNFMAIYSKFIDRPSILENGVLEKFFKQFDKYNALLDFIEKIPVKKSATVDKMIEWAQQLENLDAKNKELFTVIYQSLLEIISFTSRYAPDRFDYDKVITDMMLLPLTREQFCPAFFKFLSTSLEVGKKFPTLDDVILSGVSNQDFRLDNAKYKFIIKDSFSGNIEQILRSQEVSSYKNLAIFYSLLEKGLILKPPATGEISSDILETFRLLPLPGISNDAPKNIRARVLSYSEDQVTELVNIFIKKMNLGEAPAELTKLKTQLESDFLVYQVKDYLLTTAYALNAKDSRLKAFMNPNFVRMHDIALSKNSLTFWDNYSVPIIRGKTHEIELQDFYLTGPLSRLNITFASRWQGQFFKELNLPNPYYIRGVITNMMEYYPLPKISRSMNYNGLLVELGLELLRSTPDEDLDSEATDETENENNPDTGTITNTESNTESENISSQTETGADTTQQAVTPSPEEDKTLNEKLSNVLVPVLRYVTSGYHYRRLMDHITHKFPFSGLYFSELNAIGSAFLSSNSTGGNAFPVELKTLKKLKEYTVAPLAETIKAESNYFGIISPNIFGNLNQKAFSLFPQEMSVIFRPGWIGGDMMNEYKYKLSYHMMKKNVRSSLMGQFLLMYLNTTGRNFLRQNHINDYPSMYFLFDIFNNAHLKGLIKQLKKEGSLKLQ